MGLSLGSGKSKGSSQASSSNVNNPQLMSSLYPATGATSEATGLMSSLLNGGPQGYANSGGFNFLLNQGVNAVNSNMASRGLLNSGADMKGIEDYRNNLASTYLNQYLDHVAQMGQLGIGAGGVLANSGDVSQASSNNHSKNGSIGLGK